MWTDELMEKLASDYFKTEAEDQQKITDDDGPAPSVDENEGEAEEAETEEEARREEKPQVKASAELREMLGLDKEAGIGSAIRNAVNATGRAAKKVGVGGVAKSIGAGSILGTELALARNQQDKAEARESKALAGSAPTAEERSAFQAAAPAPAAKAPAEASAAEPGFLSRLGLNSPVAKTLMFGAGIPLALYGGSQLLASGPDDEDDEDEE